MGSNKTTSTKTTTLPDSTETTTIIETMTSTTTDDCAALHAAHLSASASCPASGTEDCSEKRCCADAGYQCYEKTEAEGGWATCMESCVPGVRENDTDDIPWTCKELGTRNTWDTGEFEICAASGVDCRMSSCCAEGSCYLKNKAFGSCHKTCPDDWCCLKLY